MRTEADDSRGRVVASSHGRRLTHRGSPVIYKRLLCLLSYTGRRLCAWWPIRYL